MKITIRLRRLMLPLIRELELVRLLIGGTRMEKARQEVARLAGRPLVYGDESKVFLCATGKAKLQSGSDRRAIVNLLVENGGCMTMKEIDTHFGFDVRERVLALQKAGWIRIEKAVP